MQDAPIGSEYSDHNANPPNPWNPWIIFVRRILALCYDMILLISILMIGTLITLFFNKGQAISAANFYYQGFLFWLSFAFFVGFWSFAGQTIGMRAWHIQLVTKENQQPASLARCSLRFFMALITQCCGGLGWIWVLLDPEKQTLYDRLASTQMIYRQH